ncbi:MAG: GDSL-type esterase/lipase family protein [Clostridium sp.]|nr:GDSL-type esterase/lipase family protein [Clostridium sp.]
MKSVRKTTAGIMAAMLFAVLIAGCSHKNQENLADDRASSDNIIITETGEVIEKEPMEKEEDTAKASDTEKESGREKEQSEEETASAPTAPPDASAALINLEEPEQEQIITAEDQIDPTSNELQLVFLGDSIFDNSRDGSGVPYLTAVQCEADVYNLAIGGTSASIEYGENSGLDNWTSRSLLGIVHAIRKEISTDIFAGTRTKEILDNPKIDFSKTDYFIIEYGLNDFFRAVPLNNPDNYIDVGTYSGALRCAVSDLREWAPDATIILCGPTYAQFFDGTWMVGDGNTINSGYGTLADYAGTCNYVARDQQTLYFNAYQDLGLNNYTAEEYLEDGVHLTATGRQAYADALAKIILKYEETKNN